jgi:hypothetical protein
MVMIQATTMSETRMTTMLLAEADELDELPVAVWIEPGCWRTLSERPTLFTEAEPLLTSVVVALPMLVTFNWSVIVVALARSTFVRMGVDRTTVSFTTSAARLVLQRMKRKTAVRRVFILY